jgi:hypothetical protein
MSEYLFHANALGVGGAVTSGNRRNVIPSHAAVVLSAAGGYGSSTSENYDENGVSFSLAKTTVVGGEIAPGIFQTYADVLITDFTVYDQLNFPRLRIAKMKGEMTSTRNVDLDESHFDVHLTYSGINVDGVVVEPLLDIELSGAATFGDVARTLSTDLAGYANRFGIAPLQLQSALTAPAGAQSVSGALVKGFRPPGSTTLTSSGCVLSIPNVGRANFGEFEFRPGDRRIRMLYLKLQQSRPFELALDAGAGALASAAPAGGGGFVVAGAVEGNGSPPF